MTRSLVLSFGIVAVLAAGLAPAAPVPKHLMPKEEAIYFPTTVGAAWVYVDGQGIETSYKVTRVEPADGGKVVTVAGHGRDVRWHVSAAGLSILSTGEQVCDPALPMLRLPVGDHKSWDVQQRTGAKLRGLFVAGGIEEVEVGAGKFRAMRVDGDWVGNNTFTTWYAPGVGAVKSAGGVRRELKSFTPGKG